GPVEMGERASDHIGRLGPERRIGHSVDLTIASERLLEPASVEQPACVLVEEVAGRPCRKAGIRGQGWRVGVAAARVAGREHAILIGGPELRVGRAWATLAPDLLEDGEGAVVAAVALPPSLALRCSGGNAEIEEYLLPDE